MADHLAALREQGGHIVRWLGEVEDADFGRPSALPGWDLRMLTAHLVLVFEGACAGLETPVPDPPLRIWDYVQRYGPNAEAIAAATLQKAGDKTPRQMIEAIDAARQRLPETVPSVPAVQGGRGPITPEDWVRTRIVEAVVHADDLSRSVPDREPVPIEPAALADAVRTLATILAKQAPGRSVEIRIPPYAAIQAVPGPRHTRGTPPNVVETDPLTWVRVTAGRETFAEALARGAISASGQRADLTAHLPLLG
jgi:uncharacterized protein (TIGR03083 family)